MIRVIASPCISKVVAELIKEQKEHENMHRNDAGYITC